MGFLLRIAHGIDATSRLAGRLVIWLILLTALISAGNAIARKTLNLSSNAWLEIQWYLFAAAFMLGAAATLLDNGHIRIDVAAARLAKKTRAWIDIAGFALFLIPLCVFMVSFSWPLLERAWITGEMSPNDGGLIRWPVYALLPAGFALLGLQAASELIKRAAFIADRAPDPFPDAPNPPGTDEGALEIAHDETAPAAADHTAREGTPPR